jgi:hypothetical protein
LSTGGSYRDFLLAIAHISALASAATAETSGAGPLVLYIIYTLCLFNDKVLNHADFAPTQLHGLRTAFRAFCLKNESKEDASWITKAHDSLDASLKLPFCIMDKITRATYDALIKTNTKEKAPDKDKWVMYQSTRTAFETHLRISATTTLLTPAMADRACTPRTLLPP